VLGALGLDLTARACDIRLPWHRRRSRRAGGAPGRYADTVVEGSR